jgi:hypothetical protein
MLSQHFQNRGGMLKNVNREVMTRIAVWSRPLKRGALPVTLQIYEKFLK